MRQEGRSESFIWLHKGGCTKAVIASHLPSVEANQRTVNCSRLQQAACGLKTYPTFGILASQAFFRVDPLSCIARRTPARDRYLSTALPWIRQY